MRFLIKTVCPLVMAVLLIVFTVPRVYEVRSGYVTETMSQFGRMPSGVVQAVSLEFKGLVADFLFLKTIFFVGEKIGEKKKASPEEWQLIHDMIDRITDLDPTFWDPYLFGEMMLPWDAGMIEEANELLLKAVRNRPDDYRPLYFLGFNHFFFQKDYNEAGRYLRRASRKPGAPYYLTGLAARFSHYGKDTRAGISFLKKVLRQSDSPKIKAYLTQRIETLKIIADLEDKVAEYKEEFDQPPEKLEDLVEAGIIPEIPADPYGGNFTLLSNGRVYTTSKMVPERIRKKKKTGRNQ
ncbi:MAG: tetratricopeptide repeat protein [Desulfurivibrionaceae bacterium]